MSVKTNQKEKQPRIKMQKTPCLSIFGCKKTKNGYIFNIELNVNDLILSVYNFKICENRENGEYFIAAPSQWNEHKRRYFSLAFFKLEEENADEIIEAVILNASDDEKNE